MEGRRPHNVAVGWGILGNPLPLRCCRGPSWDGGERWGGTLNSPSVPRGGGAVVGLAGRGTREPLGGTQGSPSVAPGEGTVVALAGGGTQEPLGWLPTRPSGKARASSPTSHLALPFPDPPPAHACPPPGPHPVLSLVPSCLSPVMIVPLPAEPVHSTPLTHHAHVHCLAGGDVPVVNLFLFPSSHT